MAFFLSCRCLDCNKSFRIMQDFGYPNKPVQCFYCLGFNTQYRKVSKTSKGYNGVWV